METLLQGLTIIAIVALVAGTVAVVVQRLVGRVTIHDYERGLRFVDGRFVGLLDAGAVTYLRPTTEIRVLDIRPTTMTIDGQEVMTADGVALKISLVVRSIVGDPVAWVLSDHDASRTLYLDVQLGLREVIAGRNVEDILAARTTIGPEILALVAPQVVSIGIELVAVEVRDVMVPADLKRAFAAVVAARHEGAAALERARGETAALRSLANAGRMIGDNPGLLSLRVIQELGARAGNTITIGLPEGPARAPATPPRRATRRQADVPPDEA